jgi:hypothetical protein
MKSKSVEDVFENEEGSKNDDTTLNTKMSPLIMQMTSWTPSWS